MLRYRAKTAVSAPHSLAPCSQARLMVNDVKWLRSPKRSLFTLCAPPGSKSPPDTSNRQMH
jgi:hypothetical protein